jgi:hypothetical protein
MLPSVRTAGSRVDYETLESNPPRSGRSRDSYSHMANNGHRYERFNGRSEGANKLLFYLRRILRYPQMDWDYTLTQMTMLLYNPSRVYKMTSWRNQTKNQWARDDPAFMVLLVLFMSAASLAYGLALGDARITTLIRLVALNVGLFLGFGALLATFGWWVSNAFFRTRHSHSADHQQVEWLYAFDIHCNAFFPMFVLLYVAQYLLLPLVTGQSVLSTVLANTLYGFAFSYYHYVSFLGYMYLPFLDSSKVTSMLYPIAAIVVLHVVLAAINVNVARLTLSFFFE